MEKGRWIQGIFGSRINHTSDKLNVGVNQRKVPRKIVGIEVKHMAPEGRCLSLNPYFTITPLRDLGQIISPFCAFVSSSIKWMTVTAVPNRFVKRI